MSKYLDDLCAHVKEAGDNIYCITEICDGVSETRVLQVTNRCQNTYSISKLFTTTAIGILYDQGKMQPEEHLCDILREELPAGLDPRWETLTVDMALRHRLGLPAGYLDIDIDDTCTFGWDHLTTLLTHPLEKDPDTEFCYTDAAFYLLARAAEKKAGMPLDAFLWKHLFYPLQFTEAAWSRCPQGHVMGATGLYLTSWDIAKLGELYRCDGVWEGQRILSKEWCDLARSAPYELYPIEDAYGKGGLYGQMLLVIPAKKRVVAWLGYQDDMSGLIEAARTLD